MKGGKWIMILIDTVCEFKGIYIDAEPKTNCTNRLTERVK